MFVLQNAPAAAAASCRGWRCARRRAWRAARRSSTSRCAWSSADDGPAPACSSTAPTSSTRRPSSGWLGHFARAARAASPRPPDSPLAELPLLRRGRAAPAARRRGTTRRRAYPRDACMHELFEAQAARDAGRRRRRLRGRASSPTASSTRGRTGCAHAPARAGRRARTCGSASAWSARSSWSSALLGVLKAGGAYVPLDPELPAGAPGLHARGRAARRCS